MAIACTILFAPWRECIAAIGNCKLFTFAEKQFSELVFLSVWIF